MHTVGAMVVGKLLGGTRQWDPAIGYWIVKLLALILPHKQLRSFDTGPLRVDIPARCCCPLRGSQCTGTINYTNLDDGRGWCAAAAAADCASTPSIESIQCTHTCLLCGAAIIFRWPQDNLTRCSFPSLASGTAADLRLAAAVNLTLLNRHIHA